MNGNLENIVLRVYRNKKILNSLSLIVYGIES